MKFIQSKVEIIPQPEGLDGIYKQIEIAGRTCYKSEDKITEDSCKEFVERMINNGHTAMLEHGTVYLQEQCIDNDILTRKPSLDKYMFNKYSEFMFSPTGICVTTNLRVLIENNWLEDLQYLCEPTEFHQKRITVRFTCSRSIMAELTRHRVFSFAVESTRYCNYSLKKHGGELTCVLPSWINLSEEEINSLNSRFYRGEKLDENTIKQGVFINGLRISEDIYLFMLKKGYKPQEAREILPNALKTEVVMTGFIDDWKHFFDLRCAPNAHPDMQVLANKLKDLFVDKGYI